MSLTAGCQSTHGCCDRKFPGCEDHAVFFISFCAESGLQCSDEAISIHK